MVGTITPLVRKATTHKTDSGTRISMAFGYVLTSALGGLTLFIVLRATRLVLEPLMGSVNLSFAGIIAIVAGYLLLASALPRIRPPMIDRQVPLRWRRQFGASVAARVYSFVLGIGILTRVNSLGFYLVVAVVIASPSWELALTAPLAFALARGGTVVAVAIMASDTYMRDLEGVTLAISHHRLIWTGAQTLILAALAGAALTMLWTGP